MNELLFISIKHSKRDSFSWLEQRAFTSTYNLHHSYALCTWRYSG
ncbi:hypothetical protein yaldo0001_23920 [Yersinia aldovae ATCC 35236]|nr:hypothetical protein yaldo0001_23920 [Yersinia aldovae ATCC 35236]